MLNAIDMKNCIEFNEFTFENWKIGSRKKASFDRANNKTSYNEGHLYSISNREIKLVHLTVASS